MSKLEPSSHCWSILWLAASPGNSNQRALATGAPVLEECLKAVLMYGSSRYLSLRALLAADATDSQR